MTNKLMMPSEADAIIFGATGNIYRRTKLRFSYSIYMLVYKCNYWHLNISWNAQQCTLTGINIFTYCFCHRHLMSFVRHRLSHLNIFLWNHWTKLNQTWQA
jgi:hypothetical protein